MRRKFNMEYAACGLSQPSIMGLVSCRAAYEHGAEWLDELLVYLAENMALISSFLQQRIPKIKLIEPEATYLAWLDCSALDLSQRELDETITHKAKLWINDGTRFGMGGEGFQRINVACPREVLEEALLRLESTFKLS